MTGSIPGPIWTLPSLAFTWMNTATHASRSSGPYLIVHLYCSNAQRVGTFLFTGDTEHDVPVGQFLGTCQARLPMHISSKLSTSSANCRTLDQRHLFLRYITTTPPFLED
ncbi:hypothetical protein EDB86DRAFT_2275556 [Lactarius hatsudake]|nr:hypothetical protein EDB86DRAFT_2275556 [Lactarius hatsudake]